MSLLVPSSAGLQPRGKSPVRLLVAGLALVAAFFLSRGPGFLPPPAPVEASSLDGLRALEADANSKLVSLGAKLQDCMDQTKITLADAFEDTFGKDDLVGPSWNPQLLAAGSAPLPQQKDPVQQIIEPLTQLFMRYRAAIYPRCTKCKIVIRWGKLWRTCEVKKHKARQPGVSHYKQLMTKLRGCRGNGR
eukprot:TRINITY_DN96010_c0_g1_i1.p1 TRINITY_DN96010_c0_g1~~TRINITY_DN96010_c0_g1_i1.p1  ORF type:complete len:190 (-),score=37.79 TRINITY_DN96010_c0_g1_i1:120-689(-)